MSKETHSGIINIRGHEHFVARMHDCFDRVEKTGNDVLTSFLTPVEQRILKSIIPKHLFVSFYGGYPEAERCIACVASIEKEPDFDYVILSSEIGETRRPLTHKDILGALLHNGIAREQLGDLFVQKDRLIVICKEGMADFIMKEVRLIARAPVSFHPDYAVQIEPAKKQSITVSCASLRMDAVVAALGHCSRSKAADLIRQGHVKLNDVVLEENGRLWHNDYVSIRKVGRFLFKGVRSRTKKDRMVLEFEQYV